MTETLVSYELAVLLKEKGFENKTYYGYDSKKGLIEHYEYLSYTPGEPQIFAVDFKKSWLYQAPTLSEAQKWLREVHDIEVIPCPRYNNDNILYYCYEVIKPKMCSIEDLNKDMFRGTFDLFNTYEQALEEGLLQGLKLTNI